MQRARRQRGCTGSHAAAPRRQARRAALLLSALAVLHAAAPAASAAEHVEADTFISDTERFPGWKGTLPGVKYAADHASGDPNRARTMAHGSLGEVRLLV